MLEVEMRQYQMTEHERVRMRTLLRTKETNHLRLIRAKLSLEQFRIVSTLGKVSIFEKNEFSIIIFRVHLGKFRWSKNEIRINIML